jgi:pimeloyl-ACP methyl ester carboxylesterase
MHKAGSGPPLLFLHGGGGFGTFDPTVSPLAEKFTVYAPSHPGFFGSGRPDWLYTINDLAHFYKDMVQELGLEDYVLVGHSVGGWIAAEMAAMDHHNIKGLVLIDAAGVRPEKGEIAEVFMVSADTRLKLGFHDPSQVPSYDVISADPTPEGAAIRHGNMEMLSRLCWRPYLHNPSLPHYLGSVKTPALVVWGKQDAIIPVECGEMYSKLLPNATLKSIDNCGHSPQMEKPDEFNAAMAAFLGEL